MWQVERMREPRTVPGAADSKQKGRIWAQKEQVHHTKALVQKDSRSRQQLREAAGEHGVMNPCLHACGKNQNTNHGVLGHVVYTGVHSMEAQRVDC